MLDGLGSVMERSVGAATIRFGGLAQRPRLMDLSQRGSARVLLPRAAMDCPEAVFLNTSGGLTSGDRIDFGVDLASGLHAVATTQTAERAYAARTGPARLSFRAAVGAGARLDWLPQETILFEGCDLERKTDVALQQGASLCMTEIVVLGRRAMGEHPASARLTDRRMVTLAGKPIWADVARIDRFTLADAGLPAILDGNVAFAVLALLGQGAEAAAPPLRGLAQVPDVQAEVSGWNGRCVVRAMAPDLWPLKMWLGRAIAQLTGRALPRVWQMQGITS
jgi:urease accessory protein